MKVMDAHFQAEGATEAMLDFGRGVCIVHSIGVGLVKG